MAYARHPISHLVNNLFHGNLVKLSCCPSFGTPAVVPKISVTSVAFVLKMLCRYENYCSSTTTLFLTISFLNLLTSALSSLFSMRFDKHCFDSWSMSDRQRSFIRSFIFIVLIIIVMVVYHDENNVPHYSWSVIWDFDTSTNMQTWSKLKWLFNHSQALFVFRPPCRMEPRCSLMMVMTLIFVMMAVI